MEGVAPQFTLIAAKQISFRPRKRSVYRGGRGRGGTGCCQVETVTRGEDIYST